MTKRKAICLGIAFAFAILSLIFLVRFSNEIGNRYASDQSILNSQSSTTEQTAQSQSAEESKETDVFADEEDLPFCVYFIDVGQGDCILIRCDGHYMVIDVGDPDAFDKLYQITMDLNITHMDALIATHEHADHIGGINAFIRSGMTMDHVYCPVTESEEEAFPWFKDRLAMYGLQIEVPAQGDTFALGSAQVSFIGPSDALYGDENLNNHSLVVKVTYQNTSFLFTGDAETEELTDLVASGADLSADVLKVSHHGASNGTNGIFLGAVMPKISVISCGLYNDYGHPDEETINLLMLSGSSIYRTDLMGDIRISSDGNELYVITQKKAVLN